ncbi:hypothetical protein Goe19_02170 [Bacillus phage vB_BsuM-Goe19]|nr:hypothetical protein Goe19_00210 [Bacillus phage vB_BsuM-Goe19]WCS68858.1 hypothetical protein Goe19_02170 [Bacillus phage vB_BsuM-Goe19]
MRTYWNVSLDRSTKKSFERLVHYTVVPIKGIHHAEDTVTASKKEMVWLAQRIADDIASDIQDTYRTFGANDIVHCSLENVIILDGAVTNEFKDRLQMLVNKEIQKGKSTKQSLSSVFESTLEKYNSPEDFADYIENTEEADYEEYSPYDAMIMADAINQTLKTQEPEQEEWFLLMVDVYTGTLTEVTVETDKDKTLDSILGKYLENGFECVAQRQLDEVLR